MILNESSRDNLLLPIVNLYKEKTGQDVSVSAMKQFIFAKLVNEANIRNLSLDSNYYLAGAARYYVNGDLTVNKNLNIFDEKQKDEFNVEICQRLNALILVLRNAYIDSVGTKWEQPEDFGTLPIKKLLRKYGAAINKSLGIEPVKKGTKVKTEEEPTDFHIGTNGYTFIPITSYEESRQYNRDTEPGAWCITYGQQHLSSYCRAGGGHFVFFLKDGYKDVPRKKEPEKWIGNKPQDDYGNSMIAFLQSNNGPGPANYHGAPLITSRWNHGHEFSCEADRAYTFEEFKRIVGITDEDLKIVYKVWERKRNNKEHNVDEYRRKLNAERLEILRILKYAQIRMNGGEKNPFGSYLDLEKTTNVRQLNFFGKTDKVYLKFKPLADEMVKNKASREEKEELERQYGIERYKVIFSGIRAVKLNINDKYYGVLIDGNKILFETLCELENWENLDKHFNSSESDGSNDYCYNPAKCFNHVVICNVINGYMFYDTRTHDFINVEGIKKFKYIPTIYAIDESAPSVYFEVGMSSTQTAMINLRTNQPLVLPNGHCWCESITRGNHDYRYFGRTVEMKCYTHDNALKLTYDSAANISYFFDLQAKKFLDTEEIFNSSYYHNIQLEQFDNRDGLICFKANRKDGNAFSSDMTLVKDGKVIKIGNQRTFKDIVNLGLGDYLIYFNHYKEGDMLIWNVETGKIITDFPPAPKECYYDKPSSNPYNTCHIVTFAIRKPVEGMSWGRIETFYVWSCIAKKFLINPVTGRYGFKTPNNCNLANDKFELLDDKNCGIKCKFNYDTGEIDIDDPTYNMKDENY